MKKLKTVIIALCLSGCGTALLQAQNLDRVAISSGGISSDTLNATIGEIFVFSINTNGISIDAGSQSDQNNTGGLPANISHNENSQSNILVYPNPVYDYLNLQINGLTSENISFQVFDISGKNVLNKNYYGNNSIYRINVKDLPAGNYFIRGYTANGRSFDQIKFIKL